MGSYHVPPYRIKALMFETIQLTEEENDHLYKWHCEECTNAMLEIVTESIIEPAAAPPAAKAGPRKRSPSSVSRHSD